MLLQTWIGDAGLDLASLEQTAWLVIDDVHELRSSAALQQLELLLMRSPPRLKVVLLTPHDMRLGLHRSRLQGGLTEIRETDLRFSLDEARALFEAAGVQLSTSAITSESSWWEGTALNRPRLRQNIERSVMTVTALHRSSDMTRRP